MGRHARHSPTAIGRKITLSGLNAGSELDLRNRPIEYQTDENLAVVAPLAWLARMIRYAKGERDARQREIDAVAPIVAAQNDKALGLKHADSQSPRLRRRNQIRHRVVGRTPPHRQCGQLAFSGKLRRMCNSLSCFAVASEGAPIIRSSAR